MAKHRKPSRARRNMRIVITGGTAAAAAAGISAMPAGATTSINWSAIEHCESGGNPAAQNASSSASGLFQFLDSSWAAYGGTKYATRAMNATPAEQRAIANTAYRHSGLPPWAASRSCSGGNTRSYATAPKRHHHSATSVATAQSAATSSVARHSSRRSAPRHARVSTARHGNYTVLSGDPLSSIGAAQGRSWQRLWKDNVQTVSNPERIHPGQLLTV